MNHSNAPSAAASDRWHRPAMYDYTPEARIYWATTFAFGATVLGLSVWQIASLASGALAQVLTGALLAALTGLFPVRIPGRKTSIAGAEIFVFLLLLLHGPGAASVAAACEGLGASCRTSTRWTSRLGTPAMSALAMYGCGSAFHLALGRMGGMAAAGHGAVFGLLLITAFAYFAASTLLMASLISLKKSERVQPLAMLREHAWAALAFVASASIADLLYVTQTMLGPSVLLVAVPIIAMFLSTINLFFRQAESEERAQRERTAAAEREVADTARHMAELAASEQRFHSAFTHAAIGMMLVSEEGRILQTNQALRHQLGRPEHELLGADLASIVEAGDIDILRSEIAGLFSGAVAKFAIELKCVHRSGSNVWMAVSGAQFSAGDAKERCLILQLQDTSARKHAEARLQHIAFHDGLTNLPNRRYFLDELNRAVRLAATEPGAGYAVMLLDFDRFKLVNDSLGHGAGDELLATAANRLRKCLRSTDLVARLGGDEFAVLVRNDPGHEELLELVGRIQHALAEPMHLAGSLVTTSASIGITTSVMNYTAADQVVHDADIAMYASKAQGKACYSMFDSDTHSQASRKLWMENELRDAIAAREIATHFQPLFDLRTRQLYGFEALARWLHPERGVILPDQFVPLAEETGLVVALGDRVLESACGSFARWRAAHARAESLKLHLNVSGAELAQRDYAARALRIFDAAGIPCERITLEITETVLLHRLDAAYPNLLQLRARGIGISIDDFGRGQSSLSVLEDLPIDEFKIDQSFVQRLSSQSGEPVLCALLALGRALGKRVIVEGIETAAQLEMLTKLGCDRGQGHFLGKPLAADYAERLLSDPPTALRVAYSRPTGFVSG